VAAPDDSGPDPRQRGLGYAAAELPDLLVGEVGHVQSRLPELEAYAHDGADGVDGST
jgi:hypothetical protein